MIQARMMKLTSLKLYYHWQNMTHLLDHFKIKYKRMRRENKINGIQILFC